MNNGKIVHTAYKSLSKDGNSAYTNFPNYDFDYIEISYSVTASERLEQRITVPKDHSSKFVIIVEDNGVKKKYFVTFEVNGNKFKIILHEDDSNNPKQVDIHDYVTLSYYKY